MIDGRDARAGGGMVRAPVAVASPPVPTPVGDRVSVAALHASGLMQPSMASTAMAVDDGLERGDRGLEVSFVQRSLGRHGYPLNIDGIFGEKTERALKSFQADYGVEMSGRIGEQERSLLNGAKALRRGDRGQKVRLLQENLRASGYDIVVDGDFGRHTVAAMRQFQRSVGLADTGVVSAATREALEPVRESTVLKRGDRGPKVEAAQQALMRHGYHGQVDGIFTLKTENTLRRFQHEHGLVETGRLDDATRAVLWGPVALRQGASGDEVRALQAALLDRGVGEVVIDGEFGPATELAVKGFQTDRDFAATGIVYPRTAADLVRPAAYDRFDPTRWRAEGDEAAWRAAWSAVESGVEDGAQIVAGLDETLARGLAALLSDHDESLAPVRSPFESVLSATVERLSPGDEAIFNIRADGRLAGDGLHPLLGGAGVRGIEDQRLIVRRDEDGFEVNDRRGVSRFYSGLVQQLAGRSRRRDLAEDGEVLSRRLDAAPGRDTVTASTYRFATVNEATRAAEWLMKAAWSRYVGGSPPDRELAASVAEQRTAFEVGTQVPAKGFGAGRGSTSATATHAARRIRFERDSETETGRLVDIAYSEQIFNGRRVGEHTADVTEEWRTWHLDEMPSSVGSDTDLLELVATCSTEDPESVRLIRRAGGRRTAPGKGQLERVVEDETLVIDRPDETYATFEREIKRDWASADLIVDSKYTKRVCRTTMSAVDESSSPVACEVEGSLAGLVYYQTGFEFWADVVRAHEVERVCRNAFE